MVHMPHWDFDRYGVYGPDCVVHLVIQGVFTAHSCKVVVLIG